MDLRAEKFGEIYDKNNDSSLLYSVYLAILKLHLNYLKTNRQEWTVYLISRINGIVNINIKYNCCYSFEILKIRTTNTNMI